MPSSSLGIDPSGVVISPDVGDGAGVPLTSPPRLGLPAVLPVGAEASSCRAGDGVECVHNISSLLFNGFCYRMKITRTSK